MCLYLFIQIITPTPHTNNNTYGNISVNIPVGVVPSNVFAKLAVLSSDKVPLSFVFDTVYPSLTWVIVYV